MIKYMNGQPVQTGDVVHINNSPYTVHNWHESSGFVYVRSMDETGTYKPVYPTQIGAYWDRVNPLFQSILFTIEPKRNSAA
jgi:hypothetical protein